MLKWYKDTDISGIKKFIFSDPYFCKACSKDKYCPIRNEGILCSLMEADIYTNATFIKLYEAERGIPSEKSFVDLSYPKRSAAEIIKSKKKFDNDILKSIDAFAKETGTPEIESKEKNARIAYQNRAIERFEMDLTIEKFVPLMRKLPFPNIENHPTSSDFDFPINLVDLNSFVPKYNAVYNEFTNLLKEKGKFVKLDKI